MIRVVVDDLAFVPADAVVRPATSSLDPTTPALRRLEQVGGPNFLNQMRLNHELAVGAAVVTPGGDLTAELVIHAVIRSVNEPVTETIVRRAIRSALQRAADWRLARLAVPLIGTGAGNLSVERAVDVLVSTLAGELMGQEYPSDVTIVVETEDERAIVEGALRKAEG